MALIYESAERFAAALEAFSENASKQQSRASVLLRSEPIMLQGDRMIPCR
jgi:hypothetical protein